MKKLLYLLGTLILLSSCMDDMKMKVRFFMLTIVAVVMLTGCDHKARVLLERAETYLPAEVDSAEMCLDSIEQPEKLDDALRAWYGLLRTYVDDRQGKGVESDSLIRDSYEYYHEASHAGNTTDMTLMCHYAQSCYYMGLFYSSCDSTKRCEDLLHQAIKYSEKCEEWHTNYLAHTFLSITTVWSNPEYASQESMKALDVYHKINDDVNNEVLILGHIASAFLTAMEPDSALKYYYRGYELAEKNHLLDSQSTICMGIANVYIYTEEYAKALMYAKTGAAIINGTKSILAQITMAQCYLACDSLERAKELFDSISGDSNPIDKYIIYRNLSEIAIQTQDFGSLSAYVDSAYESLEERFLQSQSVKYEYYRSNLTKELEKEKLQHEKEISHWIWGTIILIVLLVASFIIYNVWKNKQRLVVEHQKEMQHKQEIIHQKSMTLAVLQQQALEKLEHNRRYIAEDEKARMTKEAWDEIEQLLNDTDNNFVQKLRKNHKNFREEDIQLCMLVRMKMTNATIAKLFYITESAVKKRKSALKKTGFQLIDTNVTFEQVIENL